MKDWMINLDPAKSILQGVYSDLINNQTKYKRHRCYTATTADKEISTIKQKHKKLTGSKLGRNDPCPCGSGKKFKKCCGNTLIEGELE